MTKHMTDARDVIAERLARYSTRSRSHADTEAQLVLTALDAAGYAIVPNWQPIDTLTYDAVDGRLILIKAPSLYHGDWNPEATAQATFVLDEPDYPLEAVKWCGSHDHWVSVQVSDATHWMLFPTPPGSEG